MSSVLSGTLVARVAGINGLAAIIGLAQTVIIAQFFGATRAIEVFFAATTLIAVLQSLGSSGQAGNLFTPYYHETKEKYGSNSAQAAFSAILNSMVLLSVAICILSLLLRSQVTKVIAPGFSGIDQDFLGLVFAATAPLLPIVAANTLLSVFLRAEHHYGKSEVLNLVGRITNLFIVLFAAAYAGIWALVFALWAGNLIMLVGHLFACRFAGYRHSLCISTPDFSPAVIIRRIPLPMVPVAAGQLLLIGVTAGMSHLAEGSYAAFSYALRFYEKLHGIALKPLVVVHYNKLSNALATKEPEVHRLSEQALTLTPPMVVAVVVPLAICGDLFLSAILSGGQFPMQRINETAALLLIFTVSLPLIAQTAYLRNTNLALKLFALQYLSNSVVIGGLGLLAWWLIPRMGLWGVAPIYMSSPVLCSLVSAAMLKKNRPDLLVLYRRRAVVGWVTACLGGVLVGWSLRWNLPVDGESSRTVLLIACSLLSVIGSVCAALIAVGLRLPGVHEALGSLKRGFRTS